MTKPSEHFRDTIREYLEQRAGADALFAASCAKEHKNLDDCITFILNYVQQSGCNGFTDAEIYSLAVHYYDEDDIDVGRPLDCRVVVNHTIVDHQTNDLQVIRLAYCIARLVHHGTTNQSFQ